MFVPEDHKVTLRKVDTANNRAYKVFLDGEQIGVVTRLYPPRWTGLTPGVPSFRLPRREVRWEAIADVLAWHLNVTLPADQKPERGRFWAMELKNVAKEALVERGIA